LATLARGHRLCVPVFASCGFSSGNGRFRVYRRTDVRGNQSPDTPVRPTRRATGGVPTKRFHRPHPPRTDGHDRRHTRRGRSVRVLRVAYLRPRTHLCPRLRRRLLLIGGVRTPSVRSGAVCSPPWTLAKTFMLLGNVRQYPGGVAGTHRTTVALRTERRRREVQPKPP